MSESYLAEILFRNPCYDETLPSLVYEEHDGRISGFLGVMPRRMSMNGRPVQVAISHNFMVEPGSRSTLAGVRLLKVFFAGRQELSIAEGNDFSRKVWEGLGGATALLYSLRWTRPLRPTRYLLSLAATRGLAAPLASALSPACRLADAIATRSMLTQFREVALRASGEDFREETLLACFSAVAGTRSLRPEYDKRSLPWLLRRVAGKNGLGSFRKVIVRGVAEEALGWYLYYVNPGGIGEVAQIGARGTAINDVLDHLFHDAWRHGMIALAGQLDPRFMREFSAKYCLFRDDGPWMLVHSGNPGLLHAIQRGDAFLSRLDGEWWINL